MSSIIFRKIHFFLRKSTKYLMAPPSHSKEIRYPVLSLRVSAMRKLTRKRMAQNTANIRS